MSKAFNTLLFSWSTREMSGESCTGNSMLLKLVCVDGCDWEVGRACHDFDIRSELKFSFFHREKTRVVVTKTASAPARRKLYI